MSMLAEPRRKQKWSLNPRGKDWSEDANKFGQKMLERMGWSQGKGLGANEDGMLEHVKVSHKNDSKGIGYKESDDQWTEHESNFTALLKSLGGGEQPDGEIKLNSLEEKSQNSRVRVHYKKFTRGKDLSKYSEKDLANIFGKKSLKELQKAKKEKDDLQESLQQIKDENSNEESEKSSFFSNGGLISDYFKKKLPSFGKHNGYVVGNNGVLKKAEDSESESELKPSLGFGFGFKEERMEDRTLEEEGNNTFVINKQDNEVKSKFALYVYDNAEGDSKKKKNKKKRDLDEDSGSVLDTPTKKKKLEPGEVHEDTPIKKKKDKSKKRLQIGEQSGLTNPAFDPLFTPIKVEKHILEPIEESPSELDASLNDTVGQVAESFEVQVQINNESTPVKVKRERSFEDGSVKKKKKKKDRIEIMEISYESEEKVEQTVNPIKERKKKKVKNHEEIEEMSTSSQPVEDCNNYSSLKKEKKRKKTDCGSSESLNTAPNTSKEESAIPKKKKSKISSSQEGLDNPLFNMSIENEESITSQTENPYEVKIKEKRKKKKSKEGKENYAVENPVFNGEDTGSPQDVANEAFEVKRKDKSKKKKRKEKEEEEKGLDNPALNLNDTLEESCDLMLNVVATPILPKEDTSTLDVSSSIQRVAGVKRRKSVRFSDVTRERIIPNKDEIEQEPLDDSRDIVELEGKLNDSSDLTYIDKFIQKKKAKKRKLGLDNSAFDKQATNMEENITSISKTLDTYQAEIENDMNEAKLKSVEIEDIMVGEVGNPDGPNELLPDGSVKLKFKNAKFNRSARFFDGLTGAKKSYKHLIKGDIVMQFRKTNLHEIEGYAVKAS